MSKMPYDDIMNLPRHVSTKHSQMPMHKRAAQFSPFAALVGYEDAVLETARVTEPRRKLDEQELDELNRRMTFLSRHLAKQPEVSIEYFVPDQTKSGGAYHVVFGKVNIISKAKRIVIMDDGSIIHMDDITGLNGKVLDSMEQSQELN
jgi:hypothetical protein